LVLIQSIFLFGFDKIETISLQIKSILNMPSFMDPYGTMKQEFQEVGGMCDGEYFSIKIMTPQQKGFHLEDMIHSALSCIPNLICLREQEIRSKFSDQSLNGIDHWIQYGSNHIFIQDKWSETPAQQSEASQFIMCADRIKKQNPYHTYHYIWASKIKPTAHAMTALNEYKTKVITEPSTLYNLTRKVVIEVGIILNLDLIPGLQKIQSEYTIPPTPHIDRNDPLIQEAEEILKIRKELLEKHTNMKIPIRLLIVGASGSGKTNVILNLVKLHSGIYDKIVSCVKNIDEPLYQYLISLTPVSIELELRSLFTYDEIFVCYETSVCYQEYEFLETNTNINSWADIPSTTVIAAASSGIIINVS
jgi:hypothetical protein